MWEDVLIYAAIGFAAQLIDGAIGMAYGVTAATVLLSVGVPPATASACVHAAETFTTAASGAAHWRIGNVDKSLLVRLAVPGVLGGIAGAYLLTSISGELIKPFISAYLLLLGLVIIYKAIRAKPRPPVPPKGVAPLGFFGGMLDAIGGGGWGPLVTSNLIGQSVNPRFAIGTVNLSEFFVTFAISTTFFLTIGLELWPIIAGLILGGIVAAPLAALTTKHLPEKALMIIVGGVVSILSLRTVLQTLH